MFVLVPAVMAFVGVWMVVGAAREIGGVRALQRSGQETRGRVVASHVKHSSSGSGESRSVSSRLVETVEFPTLDGRRVRGVPAYSDVGMLDRSDTDVRVLYDPALPERFIAPKSARMGTGGAVGRIVFALVFLAFVAGFVVLSQGMLSDAPF
ncbi:DUF3592 domain-containing protein [Isoptericola sp. NPDC057559]|uniref:DUF3592 domain-containing protein n=1 Tax=Isoptericola sp. NPDC057559 TaxID=3346168 RepID=UPI003674A672